MKSIFNGRVASVFLVMLFITMGSNPVIAADVCDKKPYLPQCADDPLPDPDPDPGDETMNLGTVNAWWSGGVHDQNAGGALYESRECDGSGTISNGFVGHACSREEQVHFTLSPPDEATGKEYGLCSLLSDFLIGGSNVYNDIDTGFGRITAYHFTIDPTWNDGKCGGSDPSCLVRVRMTAYFDNWSDGKKFGRLVLVWGWGHATPASGTELNPFVNDQVLNIHDLEIFFKGIGTNRDVAHCRWYNSGIQFITETIQTDNS